MKKRKSKGLSFLSTILMIGYIPMVTIGVILTVLAAKQLESNLEESTYSRLQACAISVEQYFTWDIRENILCKDDVSYEFIDSLKNSDIELTFFEGDTRYLTSIKNEQGERIEDTQADSKVWESVKAGSDYRDKNVKINGIKYYVYYMPVRSEEGDVIGMAFAGEKASIVNDAASALANKMYVIDAVLLVAFGVVMLFVAFKVRNPLESVAESMEVIADGNLSEEIKAKSAIAETHMLIHAANKIKENLKQIVRDTKDSARDLAGSVDEVDELSDHLNSSAGQINEAVEELATASVSMAENVQNVNHEIMDMGQNINSIEDHVETLGKSSESISKVNETAKQSMSDVMDSSHKSVRAVNDISEQINSTNESIEKINEAVEFIQSITNQTKLLSLNASIEAARAGEAGRGFAVVADNIRQLSEQSSQGADQIDKIAKEIFAQSSKSVELADEIKRIIDEEQQKISETQRSFEELNQEITKSLEQIENISGRTETLDSSKDNITGRVEDLSALSEENAASNEEVTASIQNMVTDINTISEKTKSINELAAKLENVIAIFKVE